MKETIASGDITDRVTIHTPAAIIEGPATIGFVADPGAVAAAVLRWATALYETDPAKRALIDAQVIQSPSTHIQSPIAVGAGAVNTNAAKTAGQRTRKVGQR